MLLTLVIISFTSAHGLIMPMTKGDGSLDVSSLLSHISLLEQTLESKASTEDVSELTSQLNSALSSLQAAEIELTKTQTELKSAQTELTEVKSDLKAVQTEMTILQVHRESGSSQCPCNLTQSPDIATLRTDVSILKTEVFQLQSQRNVTQQVGNAINDLSTIKFDVATLKTEVFQLQSQQNATGQAENAANVKFNKDMSNLATNISTLKTVITEHQSHYNATIINAVSNLKTDINTLNTDVSQIKSQQNSAAGSATYIRWGKTTCPANNKVMYKGYTGGSYYDYTASSATILCLPDNPIYADKSSDGHGANVYGTEYETKFNPFARLNDQDMPCVVCETDRKRSTVMIPARNQCYPGWNLEYWGYLMGAGYNHASAEYICVDQNPEAIPGGAANKDGQLLLMVQSKCGSLPCPPYVNYWELTCVVCSQ